MVCLNFALKIKFNQKIIKMKKLLLPFLLLFSIQISAQEYLQEGKKRLNFAKTYFELGGQYAPSFLGKKLSETGSVQTFKNAASIVPYLNIGGMHFWGHADFYFSIPLTQFYLNKKDNANFSLNQSVVTGARFLPWAFKDQKIRPYFGFNWAVGNVKQEGTINASFSKNKLLFDAGVMYGKRNFMTRFGINYDPNNTWNYPLSKTNFQSIKTPALMAYFGLIYTYESTRSKNMEKENARLNEFPQISSPALNATKKGDWFIGIGPSSSFMLSNSEYNNSKYPFFTQKPISNTFLDVGLGYQLNKAGLVFALSYRNPTFTNDAFGINQTIQKNSIAFETFKFLTDYSGFTPYFGLNLAYGNITYSEKNETTNLKTTTNLFTPGFTFGWDILPGKTEQWFVLRTNLRWFPFEKINIEGKSFSQNQLEYNVIQALFYPSRYKKR
jgi:outer membrane protein W